MTDSNSLQQTQFGQISSGMAGRGTSAGREISPEAAGQDLVGPKPFPVPESTGGEPSSETVAETSQCPEQKKLSAAAGRETLSVATGSSNTMEQSASSNELKQLVSWPSGNCPGNLMSIRGQKRNGAFYRVFHEECNSSNSSKCKKCESVLVKSCRFLMQQDEDIFDPENNALVLNARIRKRLSNEESESGQQKVWSTKDVEALCKGTNVGKRYKVYIQDHKGY